jgi:anti-anti-sigma factor
MIERGEHVIVLHGVVDASRVGDLSALASDFAAAPERNVLVDLTAVTFVDPTGIAWLTGLARFAEHKAGRMRVAGPQPQVRRMLEPALPASTWDELDAREHVRQQP